jgi:hypothetical protein
MTMHNSCVHPLTAEGITVGENAARPAAPIARRRSRPPTLDAAVKVAKRAGADRVEIDQKSGRIVISLTRSGAEPSGDAQLENPWDAVLPGGVDGAH